LQAIISVIPKKERSSKYDVTAKPALRHDQELSSALTAQQKAILEQFIDHHAELMYLGERDAFCRGFSLAVRLMIEAMSKKS